MVVCRYFAENTRTSQRCSRVPSIVFNETNTFSKYGSVACLSQCVNLIGCTKLPDKNRLPCKKW